MVEAAGPVDSAMSEIAIVGSGLELPASLVVASVRLMVTVRQSAAGRRGVFGGDRRRILADAEPAASRRTCEEPQAA